ncbi:TPA: hypothetical protein HA265_00355, partial [Candidatus Woesearchaeota archaeon]|nr:hypothetical protein [Candidatus Woesearchaeota archaeon]
EGYSTGSAKNILYLYHPADTVARATVTTYRDDGGRKVFDLDLPRKRLVRYDMKEQIYSQNRYGIKVVSKTPIVVGASNFNKLFSGGSGGHGAVRAKEWNFAGGYVSEQATDFLNLVNPTLDNAHINVTIYYEGGETTGFDVQVEQLMKKHVMLNNHVKQKSPYSLAVISDQPIVAEMTHYDEEYSGGWGLLGEQEGAKEWLFAAGIPADDNHLAIFNPGPGDAGVTVKLYYPGEIVREFYEQLGTGRSTIQMDTLAEQGMEYGIQVISDKKIFVQQVLYERKYDAGAAMYGVKGVEQVKETAEELELADEGLEQVTGAAIEVEESGLALLSREPVAPERLGVIAEGMDSAMKSIYDDEGNKVIAWSFDYDNQGDAMNALQNILSSALMKVMEYSPGSIKDVEVYSLTAENSAGYAWQSGNKVRVVLANDQVDAMKVAEVMVSPTSGPGFWTTRNILILLAVVIIVLWFVLRGKKKRQEELDEDFDDWDNAYEDTEEPDEKKAVSSKKTVAPVKRPVKEEKKETKTAKKEEMKKQEVKKEVVKKEETRKEERKERKIRHEEDKPEVKIERIDQPQQGVQEFEVVDYEDLFKHRNRDGDEIKPQ